MQWDKADLDLCVDTGTQALLPYAPHQTWGARHAASLCCSDGAGARARTLAPTGKW